MTGTDAAQDLGLRPFRIHLPGRDVALAGWLRPGAGIPLLLVHGLAGYGAYWRRLARHLPADQPLVMPDLRGHGDSDKPPTGYNIADTADDLAALLTALAIPRAVVVGHSWGGKAAFALAARHPERVAHLVAVDPGTLAAHCLEPLRRAWLLAYLQALYGPHPSLAAAAARVRPLVEAVPGRRWTAESEENLRAALRLQPDGSYAGSTPPHVVEAVLAAVEGEDVTPLLDRIRCPVTLAVTRERLGEFAPLAAELASRLDVVLEPFDCSHWIPSDRPAELAALLKARLG